MVERELVVLLQSERGAQIDESNYADIANMIMSKRADNFSKLTTTKLRGIYGQIVNLNSRICDASDFEHSKSDLQYLKVKMAYEAGREDHIKAFLDKTFLLLMLDHLKTYDQFVLYCRYAESLVAYFKFYGGRDN